MRPSFPLHRGPDAPWLSFTADWYGQTPRYRAQFSLALDGDQFIYRFRADKAAECDLRLPRGQFVEGLWEQDVAELFVMAPSGRYQEFNLSPTGAWWCALFSGYREKETTLPDLPVTIENSRDETSWSVKLSLPIQALVVLENTSWHEALWNATAILDPGRPVYLCWGQQNGNQPDFHRADNFLPANLE